MPNLKPQGFTVSVSFGPAGTKYGCGHALDTMLFAFGLQTEESGFEYQDDRRNEARKYVLDNFDWAELVRDQMNENAKLNALTEIAASDYLAGDWYELNSGSQFHAFIDTERERIETLLDERRGDEFIETVPVALSQALVKADEEASECSLHEWLHGDHRDWAGALDELSRKLTGERGNVDWDTETDTVLVTFTEDTARDFMGYEIGEDDPIIPSAVEKELKRYILANAEENANRAQVERDKRAKSYAATAAYKAKRAADEKAAKVAAAKERKKSAL